jgi:hypothetical protein
LDIQLHNLLKDWLAFAKDCEASDATGQEWLNTLRSRTEEKLKQPLADSLTARQLKAIGSSLAFFHIRFSFGEC